MSSIPIYRDHQSIDGQSVYEDFFNKNGCMVLKNVFSEDTMDRYNHWSEDRLPEALEDGNCRHPKQKDKILINNVVGRMSRDNPELLTSLLGNDILNTYVDVLLGLGKIGSCTGHWLEPYGDRQRSHVDFPIHIGSGGFWENDVQKLKSMTTRYQLNHILPYYSLQVLIATDAMDYRNGSTELIPGSHLIEDLDIKLHDEHFYNSMEPYFVNAKLEKGDVLIFNRRLCHRGGQNISPNRRNSLIVQYVWPWGIGQEIVEPEAFHRISQTQTFTSMHQSSQSKMQLRLSFPYPKDVSQST
jgi:hypothetical protein